MRAELITIGDEILIGQIVNTNAVFLAKALSKIGIEITKITSISDNKEAIIKSLESTSPRSKLVVLTGGLGPTKDDITKHTLCAYFNDILVENKEILLHIEEIFKKYVTTPINDQNRKQALLPSKAKILKNEYGTASGMWFEKNDQVIIALPGVPFEMKSMMTDFILPQIQKEYKCPVILNKTLITYGKGESYIAKKLKDFESSIPSNFKLAYLPNLGRVRLRLSAKGGQKFILEEKMDELISKLYKILGKIIIGYETVNPIEKEIGKKLVNTNQTLGLAESLTGGLLSSRFTSHPGASNYFKGSLVAYSSSIKENILSVKSDTIKKYSVVSSQVANEMAVEAQNILDCDYAISTTGNAGPSKGDSDQPIGKIFISIATPINVKSYKFNFGQNREKNIHKTVNKALELLFSELSTRD